MKKELFAIENRIQPEALREALLRPGSTLLDVRTPSEFYSGHIAGAKLAPLGSLKPIELIEKFDPEARVYLICQTGQRARNAIREFAAAGFDHCVLVEGGMEAWTEAGFPVVRSWKKGLSILRQVQIAVGLVTSIGSTLALAVDARFASIPLLMGAGLLFAGITGICGLAVILAKMPWNTGSTCDQASGCASARGGNL